MDNKIITELCKPLTDSEIELRIGNVFENKGFSLLAYKTARADIKRLNDVCGLRWKNKFFYDEKKLLCCEILIYDEEIKEWIGRSDVGTESYTEKEKGSYSDARKRAGFSWGIGIELYKFPFIYIAWNDWYEKDGKKKPKGAYVQSWKVILDKETITIIDGNGKEMWNHLQKKTVKNKPENKPTVLDLIHEAVQTYGDKMREYLVELNIESPEKLAKLDSFRKIQIAEWISEKCRELEKQ